MKLDQVKRLKEREVENARLRKAVSSASNVTGKRRQNITRLVT